MRREENVRDMKRVYPTIFTVVKGKVLFEVPDLEILSESEGEDLADAMECARDAIGLKIVTMLDKEYNICEATPLNEMDMTKGAFTQDGKSYISYVDIDIAKYQRMLDNKVIRRNVSLPSWLDYEAEKANINVSKVLQDALKEKLGVSKPSV